MGGGHHRTTRFVFRRWRIHRKTRFPAGVCVCVYYVQQQLCTSRYGLVRTLVRTKVGHLSSSHSTPIFVDLLCELPSCPLLQGTEEYKGLRKRHYIQTSSAGLPPEPAEDALHLEDLPPEHLPGRACVHLDPARARRRPPRLREELRAVEPGPVRGEGAALRHVHARRAQLREPGQRGRRQDVEGRRECSIFIRGPMPK